MEALVSALPITLIVYIIAFLPVFDFQLSSAELVTFSAGAVLLVLGIGLFSLGADLAMTPMGSHVGAGLSRQKKLGLLLGVCFVLGMLITIAEPDLPPKAPTVVETSFPLPLPCALLARRHKVCRMQSTFALFGCSLVEQFRRHPTPQSSRSRCAPQGSCSSCPPCSLAVQLAEQVQTGHACQQNRQFV